MLLVTKKIGKMASTFKKRITCNAKEFLASLYGTIYDGYVRCQLIIVKNLCSTSPSQCKAT